MTPDDTPPSGSNDGDRSPENTSDSELSSTAQSLSNSKDARFVSRIEDSLHPTPKQSSSTQCPRRKPCSNLPPLQTAVSALDNSFPLSSDAAAASEITAGTFTTPAISGITPFTPRGYPLSDHRNSRFWVGLEVKCDAFTKEDYAKKAKYIQERLQRAVDDKELSSRADSITYGSYMVGHAADTAQPAIVVCSVSKTLRKSLKRTFDNGFLKPLNCKNYPLFTNPVTPKGARRDRPFFWLCHTEGLNIIRNTGVMVTNSTAGKLSSTWCGAWVECGTLRATVGLTLELNGITQLLTVEHLFHHGNMIEAAVEVQNSDNNYTNIDSDDGEDSDPEGERTTFEIEEDDDDDSDIWSCDGDSDGGKDHSEVSKTKESENVTEIVSSLEQRINTSQNRQLGYRSVNRGSQGNWRGDLLQWESGSRTTSLTLLPPSSPFLDWAVFSLHELSLLPRRQNEISVDGEKVILKEAADSPRIHTTPVIMISAVQGQRYGTLIDGVYYLGSTPGKDMCKVWIVVMDSQKGIEPGECGSIIVDRKTFDVYGHVVGSNIVGHAYVVPFGATIEQIKKVFQVQRVALPIASPMEPWWSTSSGIKLLDVARDHFLGNLKARNAYNTSSCITEYGSWGGYGGYGGYGFLATQTRDEAHAFTEAVVLEVYNWLLKYEVWSATVGGNMSYATSSSTESRRLQQVKDTLQLRPVDEMFGARTSSPRPSYPYPTQLQITDDMDDGTDPGCAA